MARTAAAIQAEISQLEAAKTARDPSVASYRAPDGTQVTYDWPALNARLAQCYSELDSLSATAATRRRAYATPQGSSW